MRRRHLVLPALAVAAGAAFSVPSGATLREIAVGNFFFEDEPAQDGKIEAQVGDQLRFNVLDGGPGTPARWRSTPSASTRAASPPEKRSPPLRSTGPAPTSSTAKPHLNRGHKTNLIVSESAPATTAPIGTMPPTTSTTSTTQATQATITTQPAITTATTAGATGATTTTTAARATTATTGTTAAASASAGGGAGGATLLAPAGVVTPSAEITSAPVEATAGPAGEAGTDDGEAALAPTGVGRIDDGALRASGGSLGGLLGQPPQRRGP